MPATWDEFLQEASLDGFRFDMVSVRTEGGRDLDRREYPQVDGAEIVDQARNALSLQVHAVFGDDVYPERYQQFLAMLAAGGIRELVHPVHGRLKVAVDHWTDTVDSDDAVDFGTVDVSFVEHTENALGPFEASDAAALASLVRSACAELDGGAAALGNYVASLEEVPVTLLKVISFAPTVSTQVSNAATKLEDDGDLMSQSSIAVEVNEALGQVAGALSELSDYVQPEAHAVAQALVACGARLERLAEAILAAKPPLVSVIVEADVPLLQWVHDRYGDSSRADDVLRLNSISDPLLLRAGQVVACYAA